MLKILNIDPQNYSFKAIEILSTIGTVDNCIFTRSELIKNIDSYDVLILRFAHKIDAEVLHAAKQLKVVATNTTGIDHIDKETAQSLGIEIVSLKGEIQFLRNVFSTAEHTWGLLLALIRNIPAAFESVKNKQWNRNSFVGNELAGKRLGVLGYGRIGTMICSYGKAFSMRVHAFDVKTIQDPDIDICWCQSQLSLLASSDVLSIHVPLESSTIQLIGEEQLNALPDRALLINTSRGAIIDEEALIRALHAGKIAGAALDVITNEGKEGFPSNNKLIEYARNHSNLIITPHIGGATKESWEKTETFLAGKISAYFQKNFP